MILDEIKINCTRLEACSIDCSIDQFMTNHGKKYFESLEQFLEQKKLVIKTKKRIFNSVVHLASMGAGLADRPFDDKRVNLGFDYIGDRAYMYLSCSKSFTTQGIEEVKALIESLNKMGKDEFKNYFRRSMKNPLKWDTSNSWGVLDLQRKSMGMVFLKYSKGSNEFWNIQLGVIVDFRND